MLEDERRRQKPAQVRNNVKAWRMYRGLTQEQLAERIEMSTASVSQIETHKQGLSDDTLFGISTALDCSPGDLLSWDPRSADYQLYRLISAMVAAKREQALRLIHALAEPDDEGNDAT